MKTAMDEQFDLAIISPYHEDVLSFEWYTTIRYLGKKGVIITPNPNEHQKLLKLGARSLYLNDYFPAHVPGLSKIKDYFGTKGIHNVEVYCETERAYYKQPIHHIVRYAYKYAVAFETLFTQFAIRSILHPVQGGEVVRRTATLIATQKAIRVIYLGETFIPGTVNLYSDEYRTLLRPTVKRSFPEESAKEFIRDKLEKKPVIFYQTEQRGYVQTPMFKKLINLIKGDNWNILRAYLGHKWILQVDDPFKNFITKMQRTFQSTLAEEKYFFFPFNVEAESELFIRNRQFADQINLIEQLSGAVPQGYKLYVKPHPGKEGHLSLGAYNRLKNLRNVVLMDPRKNSFDLVNNSVGAIMIASTVGLESYIMGKPTCILGNWPYVEYGNFVRPGNPKDAFSELLQFDQVKIDPVKFVQNVYKDTVDGSLYAGQEDFKALVNSLFTMIPWE